MEGNKMDSDDNVSQREKSPSSGAKQREKKGNSSGSDQKKSPTKSRKIRSPSNIKPNIRVMTRNPSGRFITPPVSTRGRKPKQKKVSESESPSGSSSEENSSKIGKPPTPAQIYREIWESIESMEKQKVKSRNSSPRGKSRNPSPPKKVRAKPGPKPGRKKKIQTLPPQDSSKDKTLSIKPRSASSLILKGSPSRHAKIVAESRSKSETRGREMQEIPNSPKKKAKSVSPRKSTPRRTRSISPKPFGLLARPSEMSLPMLRAELRNKKLSPSGNRATLVNRLGAWLRSQTIESKQKKPNQSDSESSPERKKRRKRGSRSEPAVSSSRSSIARKIFPSRRGGRKRNVSSSPERTNRRTKRQRTSLPTNADGNNSSHNAMTRTATERSTQTPSNERNLGRSHFPRITDRKPRVLIGLSGSVATIKITLLVQAISQFAEVQVVTTDHAKHFFNETELRKLCEVYTDADEWSKWKSLSDPVLHIELRKWADVLLIAPLSANTLGKLANGLADNLLTSVARAWDFQKPFLIAPAMNTMMYKHPFTERQLRTLESIGVEVINPISKRLACGDIGTGAMAEVSTIEEDVRSVLGISLPTPNHSTTNSPSNFNEAHSIVPHPLNINMETSTQTTSTQTGSDRDRTPELEGRSVRISNLIEPTNTNVANSSWFDFVKPMVPHIASGSSDVTH